MRRWLFLGLILSILALLGLGGYRLWERGWLPANQAADDWFEAKGEQTVLVQLPSDDGHHQNRMEWWYYNGHLETTSGKRYTFHYAMFLIHELAVHTVAHVSLTDHQRGLHFTDQTRTVGNPSRGTQNGFDFTLGDWRMTGSGGDDRLRVSSDEFSFNLELSEGAPPVMQGGTGLLDFDYAGESYYYSRPRMPVSGSLKVGELVEEVTGVAWFDHQWGDFDVFLLGWSWFAIQLEDGTDIMLYELFDRGGLPVLRSGSSTRDGQTRVLAGSDFQARVLEYWVSETTGIRYPIAWSIEIPDQGMSLRVTPLLRESEFDGRTTAYVVYWEGGVEISGSHQGRGFVELSGFGKPTSAPAAEPVVN